VQAGTAVAAADAKSSQLLAGDEAGENVQLNGVVMNGHDDKPFRSALSVDCP